ncbi:hypothetical protein AJ80_03734 [Polytolypa hystricis UAMH7299]|uniref:Uncharacterized protein n=1 Tax=Polytolypa hystricis (strain UAMH7299) TaxID=1447883 RepID=A0A2B7Y7M5_POLH7|nr:hypothetical protein AJ80_03734 [Polytolypa hystricis UAMH7299]
MSDLGDQMRRHCDQNIEHVVWTEEVEQDAGKPEMRGLEIYLLTSTQDGEGIIRVESKRNSYIMQHSSAGMLKRKDMMNGAMSRASEEI